MSRGQQWWAVVKGGSKRKAKLYKHDPDVRKQFAPVISIQRAPIYNDGERRDIYLNIWELDRGIRDEGGKDDLATSFAGEIVCRGRSRKERRWYFEPFDKKEWNQRHGLYNHDEPNPKPFPSKKPGPEISVRFEAAGEPTEPFPFVLGGDDTENNRFEMGIEIRPVVIWNRPRSKGQPTSRMHYSIEVDGWTSSAAHADLRTQCVAAIQSWSNSVQALERRWREHYALAGNAYRLAYKNWEETVRLQEEIDANRRQWFVHVLAFGLAASIAGGGLSVLSTWAKDNKKMQGFLKKSKAREKWFEGAEDAVQTLVGKVIESGEAHYLSKHKPTPYPSVNTDPEQFKTDNEAVLNDEFGRFYDWLGWLAKTIQKMPPERFTPDQPKQLERDIKAWVARNDHVGGPPDDGIKYNHPKHTTDNFQDELEKSLWAEWVQKLYKQITRYDCSGSRVQHIDDYDSPGGAIEKRLTLLGVADEAGITSNKRGKNEDWGYWTTESEVKRLIRWGARFKPKKFG